MPTENFHDLPYARKVAREFGCEHDETTITADDCQRFVPQLVWQQDEPIGDPACLPMHFVAQAAKQQRRHASSWSAKAATKCSAAIRT